MSARVSVIIPSYNTAEYIAETLDSVFAQTYQDYEVIVVNDGSPDTPELEKVLATYMRRINYIVTENRGLAGARNTAIRASSGEFIALLDSDDIWEPEYLAVQVSKLDNDQSADIVYPNALIFGDGTGAGKLFMDLSPSIGDVTFSSLVSETCCVMVSVLARRSAIERAGLFDGRLRRCEDFDMWLRCIKNGSRIIYHREPLVRYRRRGQSLSHNAVAMLEAAAHVLGKMEQMFALTPEEQALVSAATPVLPDGHPSMVYVQAGDVAAHGKRDDGDAGFWPAGTAAAITYVNERLADPRLQAQFSGWMRAARNEFP